MDEKGMECIFGIGSMGFGAGGWVFVLDVTNYRIVHMAGLRM
jgi:hypothetical protein